jgi:hypothetical protein
MESNRYYWVVTCKNLAFHAQKNPLAGHRIVLAETDERSPHPEIVGTFKARCDDCGQQYVYEGPDIIRWIGNPGSFTTHEIFSEYGPGKQWIEQLIGRLLAEQGLALKSPVEWATDFDRRKFFAKAKMPGGEKVWPFSYEQVEDCVSDRALQAQLEGMLRKYWIPDKA